jgi:hypothetical protein
MGENTFNTLITTLITAQSIIVAVVVIWQQYWISIYNLYKTQNEELEKKCIVNSEKNYFWHISIFSSILSWAAISAIIGVVFYIWSILCGNVICLQIIVFGIGLGCSIFTIGIIIIVMLFTAIPNWTKAKNNLEWKSIDSKSINNRGILRGIMRLLISTDQFPEDNQAIKKAVNQLKYRLIIIVFISLLFGLFFSLIIFNKMSEVFLSIPAITGVFLIGPIID